MELNEEHTAMWVLIQTQPSTPAAAISVVLLCEYSHGLVVLQLRAWEEPLEACSYLRSSPRLSEPKETGGRPQRLVVLVGLVFFMLTPGRLH